MVIEKTITKFPLKLDIQYFAEGGEGEEGGNEGGNEGTKPDETKPDPKEIMIPKSRFDEVNEGFKSMKAELDAFKATQTQSDIDRQNKEREDAEKKGEFEGLYTKAKTDVDTFKNEATQSKGRIESLEGIINGLLETKLSNIDKNFHDLIPEGMTPERKLAWVTSAESKGLFGNKSASTPLGEQTNPRGNEEVDVNKLNPLQMLMSGYGTK